MALTLAVSDNLDSTGGTATIAGADAATTATVYVAPVQQGNNPLAWAAAGSRSGSGSLALPVAPAYWFAYCGGTSGGVAALSPPLIFAASRNADSLYDRIKLAVQAKIQTLSLKGLRGGPQVLPPSQVYVRPALSPEVLTNVQLPCVIVCEWGAETVKPVVNSSDDLGWPVLVSVVDRAAPHYTPPYPTYYIWRQQLSRALRWQRLAGVPEIYTLSLETQPISAWKPPEYDFFYSSLLFRAWNRDPRGV